MDFLKEELLELHFAQLLSLIHISCHKKATQILEDNIDKLHELADYLLEKETITGDEFMRILNNEDPEKAKSISEEVEVSINKEEN